MNKRQQERRQRLLPDGKPRWVRCYDNGGETIDRYTVVFSGRYPKDGAGHLSIGMSSNPTHPHGIGQHSCDSPPIDCPDWTWAPAIGRKNHLGRRIAFSDLPNECQRVVLRDYCDIWRLVY